MRIVDLTRVVRLGLQSSGAIAQLFRTIDCAIVRASKRRSLAQQELPRGD